MLWWYLSLWKDLIVLFSPSLWWCERTQCLPVEMKWGELAQTLGYYTNYLRTSTALLWVALITAITTKWFMGGWHMQCEYTGKGMIRPFLGGTERDSKNVIMLLRTVWSWRCLNCLLLDHGWLRVIETMGSETANKGKLHYIISQKLSRDQQSLPRVVKALQFK